MTVSRKKQFDITFRIASILFIAGLVMHVMALINEGYTDRHAFFAGLNFVFFFLCLFRPKVFPWLLLVLSIQQLYSHGGDVIQKWQAAHIVDWVSIVICIFIPALTLVAFRERAERSITVT